MEINNTTYLKLLVLHFALGVLFYYLHFTAKIVAIVIFFVAFFGILKYKNKNNEVLLYGAYIVAFEVVLKMADGNPINEFGKYTLVLFMLLGIFYSKFSNWTFPYWIFLILLVPGVFIGANVLNHDVNIRKAISFNISGPLCLATCAIYTLKRRVTIDFMEKLITVMIFPIIAMIGYMVFYTGPNLKEVLTGTESNFNTSGGYGPNQVSTILGLGMFLVFTKLVLFTKGNTVKIINLFILLYISYRGLITFSRGGVYTGVVIILLLLGTIYYVGTKQGQNKVVFIIVASALVGFSVFTYSSFKTDGLISKRYAGKDALGRVKSSRFSGREVLVSSEWEMFLDNPFFGVGVGVNKQYREEKLGIESASHNEISRMLAEHGLFGVLGMLILLSTPLILYTRNRQNIFVLSFYFFWLLTINHAAMRISTAAFIYSLSLLTISFDEKHKATLHREQAV